MAENKRRFFKEAISTLATAGIVSGIVYAASGISSVEVQTISS